MATPAVANKILIVSPDGEELPINDYIQSCEVDTGEGARNIMTINLRSVPIGNNMVNNNPTMRISYVLGMFDAFYAVMFDRNTQQDFTFVNYVNEDIGGQTFKLIARNCRLSQTTFSSDGSEANKGVMTFVLTELVPIIQVQA